MAPKSRRIVFHPDVLSKRQHIVLRRLSPVLSEMEFSLAGGTALALFLGHRRSVDFDWFTGKKIPDVMRMAGLIQEQGIPLVVQQIDRGTLVGSVSGVRTALYEYRYPVLRPAALLESYGSSIISPEDIACMKLSAVAQRGAKKDFVDIFALLKSGMPLKRMLALYKRKYSVTEVFHLLRALVYFDAADSERMPRMLWDVKWHHVQNMLRREVKKLSTEI